MKECKKFNTNLKKAVGSYYRLTEYSVEGILGREYSVEEFWVEEFWVERNSRSKGIFGRGILGRREFWVEQKLPINIKKSKFGCSND